MSTFEHKAGTAIECLSVSIAQRVERLMTTNHVLSLMTDPDKADQRGQL